MAGLCVQRRPLYIRLFYRLYHPEQRNHRKLLPGVWHRSSPQRDHRRLSRRADSPPGEKVDREILYGRRPLHGNLLFRGVPLKGAFGIQQIGGGLAGFTLGKAVRYGVARGLFTNEAGLGTAGLVAGHSSGSAQTARLSSP